ncbi:hypothetical protein U2E65_17030 [Acinetobacter baumannii]|uniref:hypothetical protein n=1 Tax=Acinetobacter baumannii TaxID=470 RepID=UPI001CA9184B|nr:hypothetical protein [Acinetobacter baumannii]EHU3427332.1 hypothetical protein [Acinetobacter baumannii]MCX2995571.1 hypothetical protein [Acinetobacter baumannii]MDC4623607.1 hypothetical protein [Acinetobacter baumannii]MDV7525517.1 hypothetical protein [Acinetobacter baumannii]UAB16095.1 hypothetical protein H2786_18255 [Acinetobacter baumannii]
MRNVIIILSILLSGCNSLVKNDKEILKGVALKNLTYSHMDGMSGDIFKFNLETNDDLNKIYQENNYKYSHFKCDNIKNYFVTGSISVEGEKLKNGKYTSSGYFKVCEDESMNVCIDKNQLEKLLTSNMSCRVVFGGLLQSSKVMVDNILISKESIRKSNFK